MNYYDALADELVDRYESLQFEQVHGEVLDAFPGTAAQILDVGAGSGRDAAALADRGHHVVAVEPADELRRRARARHSQSNILWKDDRLPDLSDVYDIGRRFDVVLLSAVWMHIRPEHRDRAMRKLAGLLEPGGKLIVTTRTVPFDGRRTLFEVQPDRLEARAEDHGLDTVRRVETDDLLGRSEVDWATVVLQAPDDGTAALPTLRNIIVNDDKFSTYKLGLLRTFLRIAAESSGLVQHTEDGTVRVPSGLVCLYWLRTYWHPVEAGIAQMSHGTPAFEREILELDDKLSPFDLDIGTRLEGKPAQSLHSALKSIRSSITNDGPVKYTTHAGSSERIFKHHNARTPSDVDAIELAADYLGDFGWISVPTEIFEAMTRHWVWIEPTVVREWTAMSRNIEGQDARPADDYRRAMRWRGEDPRETEYAADKLVELSNANSDAAVGVWTGRHLDERDDFEVDHCIPYAHWQNNSLWNLVPSTSNANQAKSDRLPSAELLTAVESRVRHWWREAYLGSKYHRRFVHEADASLPGTDLSVDAPDLDSIFEALEWQVARMRRDQQIEEWDGIE
ncbi:MAG: methyltransferase domain-containing protein [Bradymonadaceae bacterium]